METSTATDVSAVASRLCNLGRRCLFSLKLVPMRIMGSESFLARAQALLQSKVDCSLQLILTFFGPADMEYALADRWDRGGRWYGNGGW